MMSTIVYQELRIYKDGYYIGLEGAKVGDSDAGTNVEGWCCYK